MAGHRKEGFRHQLPTLLLWLAMLFGTKVFIMNEVRADDSDEPAEGAPGGRCKSGNICDNNTVCDNNTCKYTNGSGCSYGLCVDGAECLGWGCTAKVCLCKKERTPVKPNGQCADLGPKGTPGGPCISFYLCNENDTICDYRTCKYKHNTSCSGANKPCVEGAKCDPATKLCMCEGQAHRSGRCFAGQKPDLVTLTSELLMINGEKSFSLTCTFQDGIPFVNSVCLERFYRPLLLATCEVDGGSAKVQEMPDGAKLESFKGSLKDRHLNLVFSNLRLAHAGLYSCTVSYRDQRVSNSVTLRKEDTPEYEEYPVEITYITRNLFVNSIPMVEMNISCSFEPGVHTVSWAKMYRAGASGSFEDGTFLWADRDITFLQQRAVFLTPTNDNATILYKHVHGSLPENFMSISIYFASSNAREYECQVCYERTFNGCNSRRRFIGIQLGRPDPENPGVEPAKFVTDPSASALLDLHGHSAFRDAAFLLCSVIGRFLANRMCSFVGL